MQFKAGYIVDGIANVISIFKNELDTDKPDDKEKLNKLNGLLKYVSSFDVAFPHEYIPNFKELPAVLAVANNIITRGLPTKAPISLEKVFSDIGLCSKILDDYEEKFKTNIKIDYKTIFELLHIVEPDLDIDFEHYGAKEKLGSKSEWNFLNNLSKEHHPFIKQILQLQRNFASINNTMGGDRSVDFSYEFPYYFDNNGPNKRGVIIEYDGIFHNSATYKSYDIYRDEKALEADFETLRQPFSEFEINPEIKELFDNNIFQIFKKNYEKGISKNEYSLIFIPLAVARIEKTIIEYFICNQKLLKKSKIRIAIIERDLPCGAIAVQSVEDTFRNINNLLEDNHKLRLPEIELTIYENPKYVLDKKLHNGATIQTEKHFKENNFDIIIDHSILRRSDIYSEKDYNQHSNVIKVRSSHYNDTSFGKTRRAYCADLLNYKKLVDKKGDGSYETIEDIKDSINFFIQNIFRKTGFREGQLPIISRALQQKPVIGLLPTGGGKSLTYQLPAFLQPGLCLVVDPIKSLMEDQVRVLKESWIDCCNFINSNLESQEKRKRLIDFLYGETFFQFVSPERFVMEEFREIIQNIHVSKYGLAFSYCIIDEVHCVSEWGHDFRSTYLMLGKNAQLFCSVKGSDFESRKNETTAKRVSLIGLTATASFDVLADIERELQIKHKEIAEAIIMIENTIRPELFFRVIDITKTDKIPFVDRVSALNADFTKMGEHLSKINDDKIITQSLAHHYIEFENLDYGKKDEKSGKYALNEKSKEKINDDSLLKLKLKQDGAILNKSDLITKKGDDFYTIIFCPTKGNKRDKDGKLTDEKGVPYVHEHLKSKSSGYFFATDYDELNNDVQDNFAKFVTGKIHNMICTKAFGMGIDKKDIRSTYHYYYSGSLESLIQEAGRSGRDKMVSEANILVSRDVVYRVSHMCLMYNNKEDEANKIKNPISNTNIRRIIRTWLINKVFTSENKLHNEIKTIIDGMAIADEEEKSKIKLRLNSFKEKLYSDREVHNFFYKGSFKGIDVEKCQIGCLFNDREFIFTNIIPELVKEYNNLHNSNLDFGFSENLGNRKIEVRDVELGMIGNIDLGNANSLNPPGNKILKNVLEFLVLKNYNNTNLNDVNYNNYKQCIETQDSLENEFRKRDNGKFDFILTFEKKYPETSIEICQILNENPQIFNQQTFTALYKDRVEKVLKDSKNFDEYILLLEEVGGDITITSINKNINKLRTKYSRSRHFKPNNDTGRLIYRMHCMGLIDDYIIDYNERYYKCTINRHTTIDKYVEEIDKYLRRYLSEKGVDEEIKKLEARLDKPTLVYDIMECLYYLAEFSEREIASKRKRATEEIEKILNESITNPTYATDSVQQNYYIKEQVYFYFNAKYARRGFKVSDEPYSLLEDYENSSLNKIDVLQKYLNVLNIEGTAQNNYKHMIGSCKKILMSLAETTLKKEWLLRLLKAFAMYCVNNPSYISEANEELEVGFDNLYGDKALHDNNFEKIKPVFDQYFGMLKENILPNEDSSFKDIEMIRLKLLLKMQTLGIEKLIDLTQKINYI